MARMPGARWLSEHSPGVAMSRYDAVCAHTIVGFAPAHAAHFSVHHDGTIDQSRDTRFRSGANLEGNHRIIAIENEDHGTAFGTWNTNDGHAVPAFTAAQVEANAKILAWAHKTHGIPLVACPNSKSTSRGIAYHRQGIDGNFSGYAYGGRVSGGEHWSTSTGKVCPGDRRISQIPTIIARAKAIVAGEEDDMATPQELWNHEIAFGLEADTMLSNARTFAQDARANTVALLANVAALDAKVTALAVESGTSPEELAAITAAAHAGAAAALDPAAIAAALDPLLSDVSQADLEAALRTVLGSVDES